MHGVEGNPEPRLQPEVKGEAVPFKGGTHLRRRKGDIKRKP